MKVEVHCARPVGCSVVHTAYSVPTVELSFTSSTSCSTEKVALLEMV